MMKHEFEERTRIMVTDEEYAKIEKLYTSSGNIDKDTFCRILRKLWKADKQILIATLENLVGCE